MWDDYTDEMYIVVREDYDYINYNLPGTYVVSVEAIDLVGNSRKTILNVVVKNQISPC